MLRIAVFLSLKPFLFTFPAVKYSRKSSISAWLELLSCLGLPLIIRSDIFYDCSFLKPNQSFTRCSSDNPTTDFLRKYLKRGLYGIIQFQTVPQIDIVDYDSDSPCRRSRLSRKMMLFTVAPKFLQFAFTSRHAVFFSASFSESQVLSV